MPRPTTRRRKSGRRPKPRRRPAAPLARAIAAAAVLAAMVVVTVLAMQWLAPQALKPPAARPPAAARPESAGARERPPVRAPEARAAAPAAREKPERPPRPDAAPERTPAQPADPVFAALPPPPVPRPEPPAPEPGVKRPRAAIIIDDLGNDRLAAEKLARLEAPLTFAILPYSPHADAAARLAAAHRIETLLHQPMEPVEYPEIYPGPGALFAAMSADELVRTLEAALDSLPHAVGINNHMGSRLTALSEKMYQVFSVLKRRGLFFVDSRTTDESICRPSARLFQIPFGQRDVFLDHDADPQAVRRQVRLLLRTAAQRGEAIAIGHPQPATIAVLREMLPEIRRQVELVPVSQLVKLVD
jgi:hypothetical protein